MHILTSNKIPSQKKKKKKMKHMLAAKYIQYLYTNFVFSNIPITTNNFHKINNYLCK